MHLHRVDISRYNAVTFCNAKVRPFISSSVYVSADPYCVRRNANAMRTLLNRLDHRIHADDTIQHIAMLCLNDDIVFRPEIADGILREWLGKKWPQKASWEL